MLSPDRRPDLSVIVPAANGSEILLECLPGNNVVYRRALVERYASVLDEGQCEDHFHRAIRRDGILLDSRPGIAVGHKMHYRMKDYVTQRFLYSRAFALPPVLLSRIALRVLASRRHGAELAPSLPLLLIFVSAWAAGEIVGYAAGAGDAMARVR